MCREVNLRDLEEAAGSPLYLDIPSDVYLDDPEEFSSQRKQRKPRSRKLKPREEVSPTPFQLLFQEE